MLFLDTIIPNVLAFAYSIINVGFENSDSCYDNHSLTLLPEC